MTCCLALSFAACNDDKDNPSSENGGYNGDSNGSQSAVSVYKSGTENGYDYVDLALTSGTRWATMNVGAKNTSDYGNYYAWGETTTKSTYNWNTYKYMYSCGSYCYQLVKYINYSSHSKDGFTDNKTTLDLSDDVAHVKWGGKWRMPTEAQQDELHSECYWVWTDSYNGSEVAGYIVYKAKKSSDKGKSRGTLSSSYKLSDAHIFLPAAGCCSGGKLYNAGSSGRYWSSSLYTDNNWAYNRDFKSGYVGGGYEERCFGLSVRAVIPGE